MFSRMNVSFKHFSPEAPVKDRYERGVDYLVHDFNLGVEEAFYLVSELKNDRSHVTIYATSTVVDFFILGGKLGVQIDGDSTWVASDLDLAVAREILRATYEGCEDFGERILGTNIEWDAYFG